ncbi:OmpA family protein [Algoriphagus marinus]|uniref:OmpA family protein n=1 Tax=Algoriphagus marinus TaxID=1925762 RepID=UPI000A959ED5|nr:OmpA family protein [Algoriphagus marinus]
MKKLLTSILVLLITCSAHAQLHGNKWRFGLSMGTTNYIGDIRPMPLREFKNIPKLYTHYKTYSEQFSYQASLEYALGNSVGLMLTAGSYQFGSGDRFVQNDGTLLIESSSFDRALNFQTNLYDAGLSFVFKPDNNWLLSGKSFFAPYLTLGLGVQTFDVSGDLLDANGNRYDYTNQNTIPDGNFETSLTSLGTERMDGYNRTTLYANLGLGVRFRITKSIEFFAQSDFKRAATDYLDDVSGEYRVTYDNDFQEYAAKPGTNIVSAENPNRGFNDGKRDWYIYHGMGIKFSFGANKEAFKPPVITQRYTYVPTELSQKQLEQEEIKERLGNEAGTTNNYFTVIQLPGSETKAGSKAPLDSIQQAKNQSLIDSLSLQEQVLISEIKVAETELSSIDEAIDLAQKDTLVSESILATRLEVMESEKSLIQGKITSLNSLSSGNKFKLDSLIQESKQFTVADSTIDSAGLMRELIIYPGQVSRILYGANSQAVLKLDSANQQTTAMSRSVANDGSISRKELEAEMEKFRSEMIQAQAKRDSAMIMAFANRFQVSEDEPKGKATQADPQEITIKQEGVDSKTAEKNNELLKDALLIGGTAAVTSAIVSDKKETKVDSTEIVTPEIIASDSLNVSASDSVKLNTTAVVPVLTQPEIRIDTVYRTDTLFVENEIQVLMSQAKIEVYFETNKATLSESEIAKLIPIKELLDRNPDKFLELVGFADNTGSIAYNLTLSEKRVESVKKILIETYQIPVERIKTGDGGLIVRGKNKGAEEKDRKVEIRIINE